MVSGEQILLQTAREGEPVEERQTVVGGIDAVPRMRIRSFRFKRRARTDNDRLPNSTLARWGLLSLLQCRPECRLSYRTVRG